MQRKSRWIALATVGGGLIVSCPLPGCSTPAQGSGDGGAGMADATASTCGNGVVEPGEQCDLGPDAGSPSATGCRKDCTWFCNADTLNGDALCNTTHNPCAAVQKCAGTNAGGVLPHTCMVITPALAEGASCGTNLACHKGQCGTPVCGDGVVEAGEECDLGANDGMGMGCNADCTWTCVATDPTRDCAPTACAGQGTCNAQHVCTASTPVEAGTACGSGQVCVGGACVSVECGDGIVEPPEQCDLGAGNGAGTGCETSCTFSCTLSPNSCVTPDLCAGAYVCTAVTVNGGGGQRCELQAAPANGTACPVGGTCQSHLCARASCGNGTVDPGEECDWGAANNVHGTGCEPDCTFSCSTSALSSNACPGLDPCSASPQVCQTTPGPSGATNSGQKCVAAPVLASCATCSSGDICVANVCKPHRCGDSCIVPPETCDPPNGTTCDSTCHGVSCGDGVLEGSEQCDDGNTTNLDGCDSNCNFEQEQRSTNLVLFGSTDTFCTLNALGSQAITTTGVGAIQNGINNDVSTGITSVIFKFMGSAGQPADLSGTTGPVTLGSLAGTPQDADGGAEGGLVDGGYNGNSDLDWWYTVDPTMIDGNRNPLSMLTGTYVNKTLTTTAGNITIKMNLSGSPARLDLWNAKLQVQVGAPTAPTLSTDGMTPGHLASEHIKSGLTTFETTGVGSNGPTGELCGNVTAASLATVVCPPLIAVGGVAACDENYTPSNSLLDVLVGGCNTQGIGVISPTQPDQQETTVSFPSGTTGPYVLSASGSAGKLDTCKDSSSTPKTVPLATCLAGLAYSSAFQFQTDRVILK